MKTVLDTAKMLYKEAKNQGAFINGVEFAQRWIPVDEELPNGSIEILCKDIDGLVAVCNFNHNHFNSRDEIINTSDIIHWRPIEYK